MYTQNLFQQILLQDNNTNIKTNMKHVCVQSLWYLNLGHTCKAKTNILSNAVYINYQNNNIDLLQNTEHENKRNHSCNSIFSLFIQIFKL